MNNRNIQQEIRENVLGRVRGGTRMHSRAYFVARIAAVVAVASLALSLSAFVMSFIMFSTFASGQQFLLGFGGHGVITFLTLFPWLPLIADIAILFLLEWLLRGFKFGYRVSLLSVFLAVFATSAVLAAIVNLTPVHRVLLDRADRGELPIVGEAYENIRDSHSAQGVYRGTVTSVQGNHIVITHSDADHDHDDGTWTVILPVGNAPALHEGDRAYVFGTLQDGVIEAEGVQTLSDDQ